MVRSSTPFAEEVGDPLPGGTQSSLFGMTPSTVVSSANITIRMYLCAETQSLMKMQNREMGRNIVCACAEYQDVGDAIIDHYSLGLVQKIQGSKSRLTWRDRMLRAYQRDSAE